VVELRMFWPISPYEESRSSLVFLRKSAAVVGSVRIGSRFEVMVGLSGF
jgi:hypothetical protein